MTVSSLSRIAVCVLGAALLSACASQPRMSASTEAYDYRANAGRTYTAPGPRSDPWGPYIHEASQKYDVPERWIREVMHQESGGHLYNHGGHLITSGAGAMGLMQVMPATYDELRGRYSELGEDPFDPHNNILAGTAYIREMFDIYGSPGFLAAYNAGPGRLDDYLTRNRTLPAETRRYVANIGPRIAGAEPNKPSPGAQFAMNALPAFVPTGARYPDSSRYSAPSEPVPEPAPIQTAAAAPAPFIVLHPQVAAPAAEPVRAPVQLAAAEPIEPRGLYRAPAEAPYIVLHRQRAEPAPDRVTVAELPEPLRPAPEPVRMPERRSEPMRLAQLPEPPRPPESPRYAHELGRQPRNERELAAAQLVPLEPHGSRFAFVSTAHAESIGLGRGGFTPGNWAVQVGAFANHGLAESATSDARSHARDVLARAHASVTAVRQGRGMLYRARLNGLSRDAAGQACQRLVRTRMNCMVISPDAQS